MPPADAALDQYFAALATAQSEPFAKLFDDLALQDLVRLEMWVPNDPRNEHALRTWECISSAKSAANPMKANYWLRRAMVYAKDFMLWDDAMLGEQTRDARARGGKSKPAKLPPADALRLELATLMENRQISQRDAKSSLRQKYGVTSQGLNGKLKEK